MSDTARSASIATDGQGRFTVSGPLTFATARRTCEAGIAAFASAGETVLVDCAGVGTADSAGLAVLVEWRRWARARGKVLSFANLPAAIQGMARISEIESVLEDGAAGAA